MWVGGLLVIAAPDELLRSPSIGGLYNTEFRQWLSTELECGKLGAAHVLVVCSRDVDLAALERDAEEPDAPPVSPVSMELGATSSSDERSLVRAPR